MNRPMNSCSPRVIRVELASLYPLFEMAYALLLETPPAREQVVRFAVAQGEWGAKKETKEEATTATSNGEKRRVVDVR